MARYVFRQRLTAAGSLMLLILLIGFLPPAHRALATASVTLNPTSGLPGMSVTGTGSGWTPGNIIKVQWDETAPIIAQTTISGSGDFMVSFTVPSNATAGNHTVDFTEVSPSGGGGFFLPVPFTVASAPSGADLSITKTDSPDPVAWGQALDYRITVTNNGPANATNVTVIDTLPGKVLFTSAIAGQWNCTGPNGSTPGGTMTCIRATLPTGASDTILMTVSPLNVAGTLTNSATVSANEPDPNTANNSATAVTTLVTYTISGKVTSNTGIAVPGATVSASGQANASATTGSDGSYTLANLIVGTYSISAAKSGYTSPSAQSVTVPPNATSVNFVLQQQQQQFSTISGRVIDASNNPISGVTISAGSGHTITTDNNGNYTLSNLPPGTYTLSASRSNYTFSPAMLQASVPPDATGQNFTGAVILSSISGTVRTANNTAIAGVTIADNAGHTAITDASGNYTVGNLPPGAYTLTAAKNGYTFSPNSRTASVPANKTGVNFTGTASADTAKPGGVWIEPANSFIVTNNHLHFAAHAYDNQGGSGVSYVNFTAWWPGVDPNVWYIPCKVSNPTSGTTDVYECDWNLTDSNGQPVPVGPLSVSFDVYDKANNSNLAPNGTRQGTLTDTAPPAAITNLTAATLDCEQGKVKLSWTSPGNDGNVGTASRYFIRYRTTPFVAPFDWLNATDVPNVPAPQPAGSLESIIVSGLNLGQTYYFAIRAGDAAGNEALMSNTPSAAAGEMMAWTAMLYLDGDNDVPGYANLAPYYRYLLDHLAGAQDNPCVNIVAAFDPGGTTGSAYYKVEHNHPLNPYIEGVNKWSKPDLSMNDPNTLITFIQWARSTYPAQHYFLSINDHGTGLAGLALDKSSGSQFLSVKNLGNALAAATSNGANKIDVVFADACYMAMIEDAYQIRNYANFYVASENEIFIQSDVYADYFSLSNLSKSTSPRELAMSIVPKHASYLKPGNTPYTISAVDLSQINNLVTAVNNLVSSLKAQVAAFAPEIFAARVATQKFDTNRTFYIINADDESIDLYNFAEEIKKRISDTTIQNQAQAVMDAIHKETGNTTTGYVLVEDHNTGVYQGVTWNLDNSHGVSIFFPREGFRRSFYTGLNLDFAADAVWGKSLNAAGAVQGTPLWGSMLVIYVAQVSPGAPDDPTLPELAAPLIPYRSLYLPLIMRR